jgi:hypothetical protein
LVHGDVEASASLEQKGRFQVKYMEEVRAQLPKQEEEFQNSRARRRGNVVVLNSRCHYD